MSAAARRWRPRRRSALRHVGVPRDRRDVVRARCSSPTASCARAPTSWPDIAARLELPLRRSARADHGAASRSSLTLARGAGSCATIALGAAFLGAQAFEYVDALARHGVGFGSRPRRPRSSSSPPAGTARTSSSASASHRRRRRAGHGRPPPRCSGSSSTPSGSSSSPSSTCAPRVPSTPRAGGARRRSLAARRRPRRCARCWLLGRMTHAARGAARAKSRVRAAAHPAASLLHGGARRRGARAGDPAVSSARPARRRWSRR